MSSVGLPHRQPNMLKEWIQNYKQPLGWSNLFLFNFNLNSYLVKSKRITITLNVYLKLIFWHRCQLESAYLTPIDNVDYITKKIIVKNSKNLSRRVVWVTNFWLILRFKCYFTFFWVKFFQNKKVRQFDVAKPDKCCRWLKT
jgi:hypothetical protein